MSFEPKKRREIERDELNIKSYLNTSLEIEGISVTEDLVSRTMNAIRQDEGKVSDMVKDNELKKPLIFKYTRTLVTVAAAALILVVGFNALRVLSPIGMKGSKSDNSASYDDAGKTEMYSLKERAPAEGDVAFTVEEADKFKADSKAIDSMDEVTVEDSLEDKEAVDMLMGVNSEDKSEETITNDKTTEAGGYMLVFNDIVLTEASYVKEIIIASQTTADMITISDRDQIDEFYSLMEKHSFIQNTVADTDIYYVINIKSDDRESQLSIGQTAITVDVVQDGTMSQSIYNTADHITILEDLKVLLGN